MMATPTDELRAIALATAVDEDGRRCVAALIALAEEVPTILALLDRLAALEAERAVIAPTRPDSALGWRNSAPDAAAPAVTTGNSVISSTASLRQPAPRADDALADALQALSNAADDINGEQDRQLERERHNWDLRLEDTIVGSVEISEGQWGALNIAIFNAQKLLRERAALAKQEPGS